MLRAYYSRATLGRCGGAWAVDFGRISKKDRSPHKGEKSKNRLFRSFPDNGGGVRFWVLFGGVFGVGLWGVWYLAGVYLPRLTA